MSKHTKHKEESFPISKHSPALKSYSIFPFCTKPGSMSLVKRTNEFAANKSFHLLFRCEHHGKQRQLQVEGQDVLRRMWKKHASTYRFYATDNNANFNRNISSYNS